MGGSDLKSKINRLTHDIETKKHLYITIYTFLFLLVFSFMFITFILEGRSFVWESDGYTQHLKALMYIRKYYSEAVASGSFPSYDFNLGFGGNVFTTLTYYGFFDPINQLSILVPFKYTDYLYSFLVALRVYLSGLCFIFMCRYFGKRRLYSIIGALVYISTSYVFFWGIKHPFFLNPMIYLPVLVVGLDLILRKKKPYIFIFGISLSALSGFYFLYMMTIMLFLYANVRFMELYKCSEQKIKEYVWSFLRVFAMYILGISLVAIVLLPHIMAFLDSNRVENIEDYYGFFDLKYLKFMLSLFYAKAQNYGFTISPLVFFTLIIAFFKYQKSRKPLLFLTGLSIICLGMPFAGRIMNGFSYATNRWMFGTGLLLSYLFVDTMEELMERKHKAFIIKILGILNVLCFVFYIIGGDKYQLIGLILVDIAFFLVYFLNDYIEKKLSFISKMGSLMIVVLLIPANACVVGIMTYYDTGFIEKYRKYDNFSRYENSQEVFFKNSEYVSKEEYFRTDGSSFTQNLGMIAGFPNSYLYFSIINPHIGEFFDELEIADHRNKIFFAGMDGRAVAGNLVSNKYFLAKGKYKGEVPYGYTLKAPNGQYKIYENKYFLPFGYTYDKYTTYDEIKDAFSLDKEANMLDMVYLEEKIPDIEQGVPKKYYSEIPYKVEVGNRVRYKPNKYIDFSYDNKSEDGKENKKLNSSGKYLKVLFDDDKKKETYLYLESLFLNERFSTSKIGIRSYKLNKKDIVRSKRHTSYFGRNNFLFNLGNAGKKKKWGKLYFQKKIKYPLADMRVFSVSMEGIPAKINKLKENHLQNVRFGIDEISGEISLDKPKILAMSIPYEKGWKAYVNGKEVPILRGNYMFSCLSLGRGDFNIELKYRTPGLTISIMLSVASFIILGVMLVLDWRKRKSVGISSSALL